MIISRARDRITTETRSRIVARQGALALLAAAAVTAGTVMTAAPSGAAPTSPPPPSPGTGVLVADAPSAGPPMPVPSGSYGYVATHDLTVRLSTMKTTESIAALPVPAQYRSANLGLARTLDTAIKGALVDPAGCVQIIVNPRSSSGGLFDYGFYAISGQYCP